MPATVAIGHSFDLPVLRYRAMVNRVTAEGLQVRQYFHRYTDDALDLCDVLGSYVPGVKVKLDEVTKILGLPGKPQGIDGSRVEDRSSAGRSRRWRGIVNPTCSIHSEYG